MMKLDILGMMITGKNPGLYDKTGNKQKSESNPNPVEQLSKLGIKVKTKE